MQVSTWSLTISLFFQASREKVAIQRLQAVLDLLYRNGVKVSVGAHGKLGCQRTIDKTDSLQQVIQHF
jgi:hypothetical protein